MIDFIINNWFLLVAAICIIVFIVVAVKKFLGLPTSDQIENIKEWLKYAVTVAEKELQSGTGQLKLRMVYDMFITNFPEIVRFIPFEEFSMWVDEALEWMKEQLQNNKSIKNLVEGEPK